jgi:phosphatidylserine/phosphatidylglycerophosphate/cardiolipin synthase-like enzyme
VNKLEPLVPIIEKHIDVFRQAGVLAVRPGYRMKGRWITEEPAIVAIIDPEQPRPKLPDSVGGLPVDMRPATPVELFRHRSQDAYAAVAERRAEFQSGAFREIDPSKGVVGRFGVAAGEAEAFKAKPQIKYKPPAGHSLKPITGNFTITCHASPDAGWPTLQQYLAGVGQRLTMGLYDFTSDHILRGVEAALKGNKQFMLTLDNPAKNPTADQTDKETRATLEKKLGKRFEAAWALNRMNKEVPRWIYPSAYHIKVSVRDGSVVWLSSGNWNNSNQPDFDPIGNPQDGDQQTARKSDRDWHVVIEHAGLAENLEAYLKNDFNVAHGEQSGAHAKALQAEAEIAFDFRPQSVGHWSFKAPLRLVNTPMTVTPLLTPDEGVYRDAMLHLINGVNKRLYIQLQYIHPSDNEEDTAFEDLIDAVVKKIDGGKDVRIITSQWQTTNGWLERLQAGGVPNRVLKIQNGVHNKGFVFDDDVVALGSQNWSGDGVLRNRDASVVIKHGEVTKYFAALFEHDWANIAHQAVS